MCRIVERNWKFETENLITPKDIEMPPNFEFQVSFVV